MIERLKNFFVTLIICLLLGAGLGFVLTWVGGIDKIEGVQVFLLYFLPGLIIFFLYFWIYMTFRYNQIVRVVGIIYFGLGLVFIVTSPFEYLFDKNWADA